MNSRTRSSIRLVVVVCFSLLIAAATIAPARATEPSAWEQWNAGDGRSWTQVEVQRDLVYDPDTQGGIMKYGVWTSCGHRIPWTFTLIRVYIYVSTYQHVYRWDSTGWSQTCHTWQPLPYYQNDIMMSWDGDYAYCANVPVSWGWTVGVGADAEYFTMSLGQSFTGNPVPVYGTAASTAGAYTYLGFFDSSYVNGHDFSALLKLHLHNTVARAYAQGVTVAEERCMRTTWVECIRVKLAIDLCRRFWWTGWTVDYGLTHIMGDGTPGQDLSVLPLVAGHCP